MESSGILKERKAEENVAKDNRELYKKHKKIVERGQGDSWRPQRLESVHGYPMLHRSHAGLKVCQPPIRDANAHLPYHEATHSSVVTVDLHAVYANA